MTQTTGELEGSTSPPQTEPAHFRVSFFVEGLPRPKGSLRHVGNGRLVEQVDPHGVWRTAVKAAALKAKTPGAAPALGPIIARLTFWFPSPQRPRDPYPTTRTSGDLDKLQRNVFDAVQFKTGAGLIQDDSQIVNVLAAKLYATAAQPEGVQIQLAALVQEATR